MGQDNTTNPPVVKPAPDSEQRERKPLRAAILVGGRSRRMGADKAALPLDGSTLVRTAVERLCPTVQRIAIVGDCPNIDEIPGTIRLADAPGAPGPMAGILAALEHDPACDWLVLACDMPLASTEAIAWLIDHHTPGADATLGRLPDCEYPEPLLAIYAAPAATVFRHAIARGEPALHRAIKRMNARIHAIPPNIARQWLNINTPQQWREFLDRQQP